jgi:hypothetical protein
MFHIVHKNRKENTMKRHDKCRGHILEISHWGDCVVRKCRYCDHTSVRGLTGVWQTPEKTDTKRAHNTLEPEEPEQIDLFDPGHDYTIAINAHSDIFVSPCEREKSKGRPSVYPGVDKTQEEREL